MAGRSIGSLKSNALAFARTNACNPKEQAKRRILHNVRSQGHTYIELREDGKKLIFFCTLCLAPCYGDSVLFDHLKGNLHNERLSAAKVTLLGPNPWPFNDGVVFFNNSTEDDEQMVIENGDQSKLLDYRHGSYNLAIVKYGGNPDTFVNRHLEVDELGHREEDLESAGSDSDVNLASPSEAQAGTGGNSVVFIPGVRVRGEMTEVEGREVGFGLISARFFENDGLSSGISRIWCEWLGKNAFENEELLKVPEHDFAVVTFSYNFNLGRIGFLDDVKQLLGSTPSPTHETQNEKDDSRKRRKSFSDPGDISENSNNHYDSCGEDSSTSALSTLMSQQYDDQLLHTRFISNKAIRRELRRKQRIAAERMCDICQHKMLPGKDVATLMNVKTGRLACSSRNMNGAFHVFHTSCLIHWVLLCELEAIANQSDNSKVRRRTRRKTAGKRNGVQKKSQIKDLRTTICSVICPECQGTGSIIEGDEFEKPTVPLSKMFKYKIKVSDARREWMKSPELLENCSTGFCFPSQSEETLQEKVKPLKLLHFYEAHC